ncbi:uncharacterized protein F5147DRAFT_699759 [Suillus discolor]|uniref:Uncharacterized protein n=1 Tax=Suillus discolor TaxID=1912936 RepID=A0A9P7F416_9AGAM|nr:uncharacterized protein F5147DRAFT_699759 [Suillus discolor]KAG2106736.1 hypothetical protein F5147DRAFT_699759 [Suillus discolor]
MFITIRSKFPLGFFSLLSIFIGVDVTGYIGRYLCNSIMLPVEDYHQQTTIRNFIPYLHGQPLSVLTSHPALADEWVYYRVFLAVWCTSHSSHLQIIVDGGMQSP